jgi:hypothetical protein
MLLLDNHENDPPVLALVLSMPPLKRMEQSPAKSQPHFLGYIQWHQ